MCARTAEHQCNHTSSADGSPANVPAMRGGRRRDAGRLHRDARRSPLGVGGRRRGVAEGRRIGRKVLLPCSPPSSMAHPTYRRRPGGARSDGSRERRRSGEAQTQGDASARGGEGHVVHVSSGQVAPGSGPAEGARFWGGGDGNPPCDRGSRPSARRPSAAVVSLAFSLLSRLEHVSCRWRFSSDLAQASSSTLTFLQIWLKLRIPRSPSCAILPHQYEL